MGWRSLSGIILFGIAASLQPVLADGQKIVATRGWITACKADEFCTIIQSYPSSVANIRDKDANNPAIVIALKRSAPSERRSVFVLPLDVDQAAGFSASFPKRIVSGVEVEAEEPLLDRAMVSGCDKDECYVNLSADTQEKLISGLMARSELFFAFSQGGQVFHVVASTRGFAKQYEDVLTFFKKTPVTP